MDHSVDYAKFIALYCSIVHQGGNNGDYGINNYLELGVEEGNSLEIIAPFVKNNIVSVDVQDIRKNKIGSFFKMTTDDFFKRNPHSCMFDVIFIDACHHYENVRKDFENSLIFLNIGGVIFLHDVDPDAQELTDVDKPWAKDAYRIIYYIYEHHPELDVVVMPFTNAGLGMVRRKTDKRMIGKV